MLREPDGGVRSKSGTQSLSLPFIPKDGLQDASDLFEDLTAAGVQSIQRYVTETDTMHTYPPVDFPLLPGQGYLVKVTKTHNYRILGSHHTATMLILLSASHPASRSGNQLVSVPYHSTASTARDLIEDIGGVEVVESVGRYLSRTDAVQTYPGPVDFPVVPGEAYFIKIRPGQDRAWVPHTAGETGPREGWRPATDSSEDSRPEPNAGTELHLVDCSSRNPCSCSGGRICLWWQGTPGPFDATWAPTPYFYSGRLVASGSPEDWLVFDDTNTGWPNVFFSVTSQRLVAPIKRLRAGSYPLHMVDESVPPPPEVDRAGALQSDESTPVVERQSVALQPPDSTDRSLCDVASKTRRADIPSHDDLVRQIKFPRSKVDPVRYVDNMLPGLYGSDARVRAETATRLGLARTKYAGALRGHDDRIAKHLIQIIQVDQEVQVIEEALLALSRWQGAEGLPDIIAVALQCTRSEQFLRTVLSVAAEHPDESFLPPLIELWRSAPSEALQATVFSTLSAQGDPTTVWIGLDVLTMRGLPAIGYLSSTATVHEVPQLIAAFHEHRDHPGFPDLELLDLIATLGGEHAQGFLEAEFISETAGDKRGRIATLALRVQLERDKPTWTDADHRNCTPREVVLTRGLPYIRSEVERLLDPRNRTYLRAADWSAKAGEMVLKALREGARALPLDGQVDAWRYLLDAIDVGAGERVARIVETARVELVRALARRASHRPATAAHRATKDIEEAIAVADATETFTRRSSASDELSLIRRRIARLSEATVHPKRPTTLADVAGEYTHSTGFTGAKLRIKPDGRFERNRWSDVIDHCAARRIEAGTARLEEGYVVLEDDPSLSRRLLSPALGPEVYAWVTWEDRRYLVAEQDMESFCNSFNSGELARSKTSRHYHTSSDEPVPEGGPNVPREWTNWILPKPIEATVTRINDDSSMVVSSDEAQRLEPGMLLYGAGSVSSGVWKVVGVDGGDVTVAPLRSASRASVGERVSTRQEELSP